MKNNLPVIILKDVVMFPMMDIRVEFETKEEKETLDKAEVFHDSKVLIIIKDGNTLPKEGVIAFVSHKMKLPNGNVRALLTGISKVEVKEYLENGKQIESIVIPLKIKKIENEEAYIKKLQRELKTYIDVIPYVSNSILASVLESKSLDTMIDLIVPILDITYDRQVEYIKENDTIKKVEMVLEDIYKEEENFTIEKELDGKVKRNLDESQREFLLREKMKLIKQELKESSLKEDEVSTYYEKLDKLNASEKIKDRIKEEIKRLESLSMVSPEVSVVRNYIDWLFSLPWEEESIDNDDLKKARSILDETHSGLEKAKERIIEYLAAKQMKGNLKSPVICFIGPPGVGKTSFAYSIAKAMDREFVKISVGGIHDEAEIIGHRRTYLGSAPGRIIQGMKKAKTKNPVFLIDEIDKMTKDYKGDPASVLLEILDKEQNMHFSDNFIEEEFDLSKVVFITTANYEENIPEALKDRLEIIHLSGYTEYEKVKIAKDYLLPKLAKEHGLNSAGIKIREDAILDIIRYYTRESGVRELERKLSTILRKIVTQIVVNRMTINKVIIDSKKVEELLGVKIYQFNKNETKNYGVVNGLAYTYYGGDTQEVEVTYFAGKGNIILTGMMGEVMSESVSIALDYIKSNASSFDLDVDKLNSYDFHVHVPFASVKKEGPSAGTAIVTAFLSCLTKKKIKKEIAFTGEVTLKGKVLAIGGLKEKVIGANRNHIKQIFLPEDNRYDLEEIGLDIKKDIEFIFVKNYMDIYDRLWRKYEK